MLPHDFSAIFSSLDAESAEYLVVGAYALAAHGLPRATGDLDIWIAATPTNAARVWRALAQFGAPMDQISEDDLRRPDTVFQIGVAPRRIDILTSVDGVEFADAWRARIVVGIEKQNVPVISREHLILNKRAVGRPQDLADVRRLEDG